MNWLSTILLLLLAGCGVWFWNFRRNWRHLAQIIDELSRGGSPTGLIFHRSKRFDRIGRKLETLAVEHGRVRDRLRNEEFNLRAIVSSMVEGLLVVDTAHVIRLANDALMRDFQLHQPPVGRTVLEALREAAVEELIRAALASDGPQTREISLHPPGLAPRHFAVNAVATRDTGGGVTGAVAILHDITRLRQLEEMRRDFVANVSHELRTPLSIFQGYIETLVDHPDMPPAEAHEILRIMEKHSQRLNAIVEDLLTLARLESRELPLHREPLDIGEFLAEMARDWQVRAGRKKIVIAVETAPGLPTLTADPLRMEQVFNNLLDNAVKYTPEGGRVVLKSEQKGDDILFSVSDSGVGIPPASLPHIFERFYRVDKDRSRELGGTGLGLSIVKHIAALHGGTVDAQSAYGQGTTIRVRIPSHPPEPAGV